MSECLQIVEVLSEPNPWDMQKQDERDQIEQI